jgi:TRAP-type C4-dicarboxylate transport system permease small subunit
LWCGVAALAVTLISYLVEIVWRYFLNDPTLWANDTVAYMLAVGLFLVLPAVTASREHVAIGILPEILPPVVSNRFVRLGAIAGAVACALAGTSALLMAGDQAEQAVRTIATLPIPKWWLSALAGYAFWCSAGHFLRQCTAVRGDTRSSTGRRLG